MIKAFTLGLIMGAVIGAAFGVLIMACVQAGKDDDYMANKISHAKDPDRVNKMKAMSEVKLKPCPFCGQIPNLYGQEVRDYANGEWAEQSRKEYWVQPRCLITCLIGDMRVKAFGVIGGVRYMSANAAIKAWNTRYTDYPSEINENAPNSGENNSSE